MKTWLICAGLAGVALMSAAAAGWAADNEAGVPLSPAEASGAWTLESGGRDICVVTLGANHSAKADAGCAGALPGNPVAWQPTADGMQLVGANGQPVIGFGRWSNSLFVSHQSSGEDIQLKRGASADVSR